MEENGRDTSEEGSGEDTPPEEVFGDAIDDNVTIAIKS